MDAEDENDPAGVVKNEDRHVQHELLEAEAKQTPHEVFPPGSRRVRQAEHQAQQLQELSLAATREALAPRWTQVELLLTLEPISLEKGGGRVEREEVAVEKADEDLF